MTMDIHQKVLKDHPEIASLPHILVEVLKVSADPDSSAAQISKVILKDPALTAKILRVVNSPYYGRVREVTTINQAVVTLGVRSVTAIALSSSVYKMTENVEGMVSRKRFWRHSLEVAIAARMIAEEIRFEPGEEAFVAGLLHEIGLLVLEASYPEEYRRMWKQVEAGEFLTVLEQEMLGTDHARAGQFLLDQWGVPRNIGEAVGRHHAQFDYGVKASDMLLPQVVLLANQLSKFRAYTMPPPEPKTLERKDAVASNLNLSHAALAKIEGELISIVVRESDFLEIEIGTQAEILAEANQMLYRQFLMVENLLRENRRMQQSIAHDQAKRAALESLKAVANTFSNHINNATAAILGRAQLIEMSIKGGQITGNIENCQNSLNIIMQSVESISSLIGELKRLTSFDSSFALQDKTIIDIEREIRDRINDLNDRVLASV